MPDTPYFSLQIGNKKIDIDESKNFPISISYELEDADNFEQKKGSSSFDVEVPATQENSQASNSFHNPNFEDLSANEFFKSHQPCEIFANGKSLLKGKAFLKSAKHTDRPTSLIFDLYGGNSDWIIDLKELTLLECVNPNTHLFNSTDLTNSFSYNGRSESLDYIYAPVRYLQPFDEYSGQKDVIVTIFHLKPSISIYWILYRAFKSAGYQISSTFFDTDYFRRLVMPWTWGSFLYTDDIPFTPLKFRAMCTHRESVLNKGGSWNEWVSPDVASVNEYLKWADVSSGGIDGGFEGTPGLYSGVGVPGFPNNHDLNYYYPAGSPLGTVSMGFEAQIYYAFYTASGNSSWGLRAVWFVNGVQKQITLVKQVNGHGTISDNVLIKQELTLNPGDVVTLAYRIDASAGISPMNWTIGAPYPPIPSSNNNAPSFFRNSYIKKAVGSPVNLKEFAAFGKYKFLDLLRGLTDFFNFSFSTDPLTKTVTIEPTYDYEISGVYYPGYYKSDRLDWTAKQDLSKESEVELFSDSERQLDFVMKADANDAGIKIINERHSMVTGKSRYLFPDRFQAGIKEMQNRFFSPVAHMFFNNWGGVTGVSAQIIAMIPENISNTSKAEDENKFEPKLAYYKGNTAGVGGWFFQYDPYNPATLAFYSSIPFMFAVNYQPGGESDPVLTYNDQGIFPSSGINQVFASGLMRKFFLRRLAIMRNGKRYSSWFYLQNIDVDKGGHREQISIKNARYNLVSINSFEPLKSDSTAVTLWKDYQPTQEDSDACFPSALSVKDLLATIPENDLKFHKNLILKRDIPDGSN